MAESTIENSGWGIYVTKPMKKGDPVVVQDPIIHVPDVPPQVAVGMKRIIWEYLWDAQQVGGQYEGQNVLSMIPGIGMLANGCASKDRSNVVPGKPPKILDPVSTLSPAAGASSEYHNFTWFAARDLQPGEELFVHFGKEWFQERGYNATAPDLSSTTRRSVGWIEHNGHCLDNIVPGISKLKYAGHGAFASRVLDKDQVIAPVPVLPLLASSLEMIKQRGDWDS